MIFTEKMNEDALDLIAAILEPVSKITADKKLLAMAKKSTKIDVVKYLLKNHKTSVIEFLAILNGVKVEEYKASAVDMMNQILDLVNDPEFANFFKSAGVTKE